MVMDDHLEDVLLHQYVKIALAVAIIRRKPKGVTARAYIDDLLKEIKLRDRREEVSNRHLGVAEVNHQVQQSTVIATFSCQNMCLCSVLVKNIQFCFLKRIPPF